MDGLRDLPYWERNYPQVLRVETFVRASNARSSAAYWAERLGAGLVELAPRHLCELIVLHEVAHVLASARYGSRSHDPWFARVYLELVYEVLGSEAYSALRERFDVNGVDYDVDQSVPAGVAL